MAGKVYSVSFLMGGKVDSTLTRSFTSASGAVNGLSDKIKSLGQTSSKMNAFRQLGQGVRSTQQELSKAKAETAKLGSELSKTANPTRQMVRNFETARNKVSTLEEKLRGQRNELKSVSQALKDAGVSTRNFSKKQEALNRRVASMGQLKTSIQNNQAAIAANKSARSETWGQVRGTVGSVIALGAPLVLAAKYEQELNRAKAIGTLSDEDAARHDALYRNLGATTEYSATEAARTGVTLTRAGFSTSELEAGLPSVLDMATANSLGLEETASMLADAMRSFRMDAGQMSVANDIITKSANSANMSVQDFSETLKYAAAPADALNVSMAQVGAMTGVMAGKGIKGSQAGTAVREMLLGLVNPSDGAAKALKRLGVHTVDLDGDMMDLPIILDQLRKATANMGNAEKTAFFNDIAGKRGAIALMNIMSAEATGQLAQKTKDIEQSQGYAAKAAETMRKGVVGAYQRLRSAIEAVGLNLVTKETGEALSGQIDAIAKWVGSAAQWIGENPKLVGAFMSLAKWMVVLKLGGLGLKLGFLGLQGTWLRGKSVLLNLKAGFMMARHGMDALNDGTLAGTTAGKIFTAGRKVMHGIVAGGKWVASTLAMAKNKAMTLAMAGADKVARGAKIALNAVSGAARWARATTAMVAHKAAPLALAAGTKIITAAQWLWNAALSANPIGAVILAIGGLIAAGTWLYKNWDWVTDKLGGCWDWVKTKAGDAWQWTKDKAVGAWETIQKFPDWLGDLSTQVYDAVTGWFSSAWTWVKDEGGKLVDWFATLPAKIANAISGLFDTITGPFKKAWKWVEDNIPDFLKGEDPKVFSDGNKDVQDMSVTDLANFATGVSAPATVIVKAAQNARGGIIKSPMLSTLAEEGEEVVIPTDGRHKDRSMQLISYAGQRLGVDFVRHEQRSSYENYQPSKWAVSGQRGDEKVPFPRSFWGNLAVYANQGLSAALTAAGVQGAISTFSPALASTTFSDLASVASGLMSLFSWKDLAGEKGSDKNIDDFQSNFFRSATRGEKGESTFIYAPQIYVTVGHDNYKTEMAEILKDNFIDFSAKIKEMIEHDNRLSFSN